MPILTLKCLSKKKKKIADCTYRKVEDRVWRNNCVHKKVLTRRHGELAKEMCITESCGNRYISVKLYQTVSRIFYVEETIY